jgi:hypothetical protein
MQNLNYEILVPVHSSGPGRPDMVFNLEVDYDLAPQVSEIIADGCQIRAVVGEDNTLTFSIVSEDGSVVVSQSLSPEQGTDEDGPTLLRDTLEAVIGDYVGL